MWNPIKDIRDAWTGSASKWGKGTVVLFYTYVWVVLIALNLWQVIVPVSQGDACAIKGVEDEWAKAWIPLLLRQWGFFGLVFALYAVWIGAKVWNIAYVTAVVILCFCFALFDGRFMSKSTHKADMACWNSLISWAWVYSIWPVLALLLAIMENRAMRGTSSETQPLV